MRIWRYQGVHRLAWIVIALLVLAVAVFAMAAGFARLHELAVPAGAHLNSLSTGWCMRYPGRVSMLGAHAKPLCFASEQGDTPAA